MTFLPERDQTTGQATGKWYNDEISTPITEKALREKGFKKNNKGIHSRQYNLRVDQGVLSVIFYPFDSPTVLMGDCENFIEFDCQTMQDIDDLIRLLGGKNET